MARDRTCGNCIRVMRIVSRLGSNVLRCGRDGAKMAKRQSACKHHQWERGSEADHE